MNGMHSVRAKRNKTSTEPGIYFSYSTSDHLLVRNDDNALADIYNKMSDSEKSIFNGADYTCIYKLYSEIDSLSNSEAKLSVSHKAVLLKLRILNIINSRFTLENKIHLK